MTSTEAEKSGNEQVLCGLLAAVLTGDVAAWQLFQAKTFALLEGWARTHRGMKSRRMSSSPDDHREIALATLERLHGDDFRSLRRFTEAHPMPDDAALKKWAYKALDYATQEHLRARFGRLPRKRAPDGVAPTPSGPSKRDINTLAPRLVGELADSARTSGITSQVAARQIVEYVHQHFSVGEVAVLQAYFVDEKSWDELAEQFGLESRLDAERMVRRLKERLRAQFESRPV